MESHHIYICAIFITHEFGVSTIIQSFHMHTEKISSSQITVFTVIRSDNSMLVTGQNITHYLH